MDEIQCIRREDPAYPPLLREIADPPLELFVRGRLPDPHRLHLAVVGTRACTPYGVTVARQIGRDLGVTGTVIVSGLALGIDAIAHAAVLDVGGTCVAVLGTGVDDASLYPRANVRLAHRIIEGGGAVVSEFPPGTGSQKYHFPLRNRIISGICRGTIIIEAAEGSGSLITARQSLEQNREVFAVPGPITSPQSAGTNALLKQGAIPCLSTQDILEAFNGATPVPARRRDVTADERLVLDALEISMGLNDLARHLSMNASAVCAIVTTLELDGFVISSAGHFSTKHRPSLSLSLRRE